MRNFVENHPLYRHDSIVNERIQYDLIWTIKQMTDAKENNPFQTTTNNSKLSQMRY